MSYIVIASANSHKVDEYRDLLKDQEVELQSLADYPAFLKLLHNCTHLTR